MSTEEFKNLGLPVPESSQLYVESALEWMQENTTLTFDPSDAETVKSLPASAKLFLVKFCEICEKDIGVTSETVGPMSQSFKADSASKLVYDLARQLLKAYLKTNVKFLPCRRRWR